MDRKTGLPPSGSTMGNNALRIKNRLFAASTMTNLHPHIPALNTPAPSSFVSHHERANAPHIITLIRQIKVAAVNVSGTKGLVSTGRQRLPEILRHSVALRAGLAPNRAIHHPSPVHTSALRPVKRSCLSWRWDVARRKSARSRSEQVTP